MCASVTCALFVSTHFVCVCVLTISDTISFAHSLGGSPLYKLGSNKFTDPFLEKNITNTIFCAELQYVSLQKQDQL